MSVLPDSTLSPVQHEGTHLTDLMSIPDQDVVIGDGGKCGRMIGGLKTANETSSQFHYDYYLGAIYEKD